MDKSYIKNNVRIKVEDRIIFQDYEVFNITVSNNTMKTVLLDSQNETDNIYIQDADDNKYYWLNNEYFEEELTFHEGEQRTIPIKFSRSYDPSANVLKIEFSKIIIDNKNAISIEIYI